MLENDSGQNCSLKSIHLLPEISVTDADFTATLTADQVRTCALEILSHAARAYLDPRCTEFTAGMLTEAIAAVLGYTRYAAKGCPPARKKLHNAAALAGASYGNIVDAVTPISPIFQRSRRFPSMTTTCAAPNWRSVWGLMIAGLCLQPVRHFRMCRRSVFFAYAREYVW